MPKIVKNIVDANLRKTVFDDIFTTDKYVKINDRQYGILLTDLNGTQRYVRIGVIVAEEREDMNAADLMQSEIDAYNTKQAEKRQKAEEKEKKIAADKKKREEKARKEEEG